MSLRIQQHENDVLKVTPQVEALGVESAVYDCLVLFRHECTVVVTSLPSVVSRCWLGSGKGIRPVKTEWCGAGVVICLVRGADLHMAKLIPLPLTVSCFSKIQIGCTAGL